MRTACSAQPPPATFSTPHWPLLGRAGSRSGLCGEHALPRHGRSGTGFRSQFEDGLWIRSSCFFRPWAPPLYLDAGGAALNRGLQPVHTCHTCRFLGLSQRSWNRHGGCSLVTSGSDKCSDLTLRGSSPRAFAASIDQGWPHLGFWGFKGCVYLMNNFCDPDRLDSMTPDPATSSVPAIRKLCHISMNGTLLYVPRVCAHVRTQRGAVQGGQMQTPRLKEKSNTYEKRESQLPVSTTSGTDSERACLGSGGLGGSLY